MNGGILVLAVVLAVVILFMVKTAVPRKKKYPKDELPVPHKLHSWVIDENGKHWCSVCNLVAGTVQTGNGDY